MHAPSSEAAVSGGRDAVTVKSALRPPTDVPGLLPVAALIVLGTAGMFFGQPNTIAHLPWLVLLFPFCLCIMALSAPSYGSAFRRAFLLGLAGNSAGLYWLVFPMNDVAGMPLLAAAPCVALLASYLALYAGLTAMGMRRIRLFFSGTRPIAENCHADAPPIFGAILSGLLGGMVYGGFEVLSGTLFTGFPWLSLGSAFAFRPEWVQTASITGSYGLSAVYAAVACFAADTFLARRWKHRTISALLALVLCASVPAYGVYRLSASPQKSSPAGLSVILVQGNVDQNQKWVPLFQEQTLKQYMSLTTHALEEKPAERPVLVVWPETAMPFAYQLHRDYAAALRGFAARSRINLLFGTLGVEVPLPGTSDQFNRVYLISSAGAEAGHYDKRHLVPFGEYIPLAIQLPFLSELLQGLDFSSGRQALPLELPLPLEKRDPLADAPLLPTVNGQPQVLAPTAHMPGQSLSLGVLICYEAIFPYLAQEQVKNGASILINVSNDAWFRTSSAPWQHLSLAVMRAVEQSRPIVRSTNTGVSAVIDARGRLTARGKGLFTTETLEATVEPDYTLTAYHRIYPAPQWLLVVTAVISLLPFRRRKPTGSGQPEAPEIFAAFIEEQNRD